MDRDTLQRILSDASLALRLRLVSVSTASHLALEADQALAEKKAEIVLRYADDAKALGANEAARTARINELCAEEIATLRKSQSVLAREKTELEVAQIEWSYARNLVRLYTGGEPV